MRRLADALPALDYAGQACQCNQALLYALIMPDMPHHIRDYSVPPGGQPRGQLKQAGYTARSRNVSEACTRRA